MRDTVFNDLLQYAILCAIVALYFLPSIVAWKRRHQSRGAIYLLNFFAGWTALGWFGALIWAASAVYPRGRAA